MRAHVILAIMPYQPRIKGATHEGRSKGYRSIK